MDLFYFIIILVALIIFFLDRLHNVKPTKENFVTFPPKTLGVDYGAPSPEPYASQGLTNINMSRGSRFKTGFRKFGPTPPNGRCNVTVMGENCTNFPGDGVSGAHQAVCQRSVSMYPSKWDNLVTETAIFKGPIDVMGRSLTRVNQCRDLYQPKN